MRGYLISAVAMKRNWELEVGFTKQHHGPCCEPRRGSPAVCADSTALCSRLCARVQARVRLPGRRVESGGARDGGADVMDPALRLVGVLVQRSTNGSALWRKRYETSGRAAMDLVVVFWRWGSEAQHSVGSRQAGRVSQAKGY